MRSLLSAANASLRIVILMHFSFLSTPGHRRLFPCLTDRLCIDCVLLLRDDPGRSGLFLFDGLRGSAFIASRLLFFRTGPSPTARCKDIISSALWPYMGEMTAYLLCACSELWCHVLLAEGPDPSSGGFSRTRAEVRGTTVYASDTLPLGDIEGISTSPTSEMSARKHCKCFR